MRAIWKGSVSFGLVSVPVKLYSATESHDVSFRQVHATDGGRIRYQRICAIDGEEVPYSDIAKGFETEDGEMVILDEDDMANLPVTSSREIAVEKFVPRDQIDPMLFEKSYYLEPESSGAKPYALLRQALVEADRMAVVTIAIRQRTTIAVLRVRDDVIVLQTMMWPDEIRTPDFTVESGEVKDSEVKMARMLVDTLAGDFDADEFEDDYAEAVQAVVKAKIEGGEVQRTATSTKTGGEVVDLLAALQRSVAAAKTARGEEAPADDDAEAEEKPASPSATKKSTAKKAPAKKASTAKKTATKKTAAKKAPAKKTATKKTATKKAPPRRPPPRRRADVLGLSWWPAPPPRSGRRPRRWTGSVRW
ncbi:non-homologous end joining protein Ku [Nocardioides sambongensis]|uniref:non-homologous end joining protein Ku n=1 Tax=Nocardioides sambongensis TaxID=2589074 RepID=UPI00112D11F0|nr:Ku protein [Nocardioides sambongensis]